MCDLIQLKSMDQIVAMAESHVHGRRLWQDPGADLGRGGGEEMENENPGRQLQNGYQQMV